MGKIQWQGGHQRDSVVRAERDDEPGLLPPKIPQPRSSAGMEEDLLSPDSTGQRGLPWAVSQPGPDEVSVGCELDTQVHGHRGQRRFQVSGAHLTSEDELRNWMLV